MATSIPKKLKFQCPNCGRKMRVPESAAGLSGICRGCGIKIKIPKVSKSKAVPTGPALPPVDAAHHTPILVPAPTQLALASPPQAAANPVGGPKTILSVAAIKPFDSRCTYTWSVAKKPPEAAMPLFSVNGSNNAKQTEVRFYRAGEYLFRVTVKDGGQSMTSELRVTVSHISIKLVSAEGSQVEQTTPQILDP